MSDDQQTPGAEGEVPRLELSGLPSRRARLEAERAQRESEDNGLSAGASPRTEEKEEGAELVSKSAASSKRNTSKSAAKAGKKPNGSKKASKPGGKSKANSQGQKRSIWSKLGMGLLFLILIGIIAGTGLFLTAYAMIKVPEPGEFALAQKTTVYYADGKTAMGTFAEIDRTVIDASTLPEYVGKAVVSSEDRSFFTNSGIDIKGIGRALLNNLTTDTRQGGSTLSQQYVERYYLDTTTGYLGKMKEAILALKINRQQSKDEILGNYLNTIYFGRGAYGIEEASQKYFGHPATELTLSESAMLAGIIPAPSAWDPAIDPEQAKARWERVLKLMVEDGYIGAEDAQAAQFPEVIEHVENQSMSGTNGYLMQQIRSELAQVAGLSDEEIDSGGFNIVSTIDRDMQVAAIEAVRTLPSDHAPNMRIALSAIDPANGEVKASYGGADYLERQINAVTQDRAMAGSTFKPFGLLAYVEAGGSLDDMYNGNSPLEITDDRDGSIATVNNYAFASFGYVDMKRATALSINTAYAEMNNAVGPKKTKDTAIKLGYPEDTPGLGEELFNILGSASPHNIDITRAYATLASGGVRTDPHFVKSVTDKKGGSIYEATIKTERVFAAEDVSGILPALEATAQWGTAEKASSLGRPVGAKTGSSDDNRSAQFAGFIPQLAATVSIYQPTADGMGEESITPFGGVGAVTGSTWPGSVWRDFMLRVTENLEVQEFEWYKPLQRRSNFDTYTPPPPPPSPTPTPTPQPTVEPEPAPTPTPVEPVVTPPPGGGGEHTRPTEPPAENDR
ncbi:MAG: transglycosylase domain-containing protein [Actinomycetaceae bacterium]|nr:transglycosylase domain-containing protein [Actinomycetaceae bacterium]